MTDESGNGQAVRLTIPRRAVVPLLLAVIGGSGWFTYREASGRNGTPAAVTREWKQGVDDHVKESVQGFSRLGAVENRVSSLETELREMRRDQIDQWRWEARRIGADDRVRELEERLRALGRR